MDMIERVAQALYESTTNNAIGWECENPTFWWKQARAAIAAMREPTEDMVAAADLRDSLCTPYDELWKAMIDAALECSAKQTEE